MFMGFQAMAHCSSLSLLKAGVFIFGLGGGIINGATNALVADISINKGPDLSLLGVFFGLGAIGMPLILGMLSGRYGPFMVTAAAGWLSLIVAAWFAFTRFPPAKQQKGMGFSIGANFFRPILILISFFLFFQSSLEAIVNNWTTNYLAYRKIIPGLHCLICFLGTYDGDDPCPPAEWNRFQEDFTNEVDVDIAIVAGRRVSC